MKVAFNSRIRFAFRCCVAGFLITFLVLTVGIDVIVKTFLTMDLTMGILTWICLITLFLLGGFNLWLLLNSIQSISFFKFLKVYTDSWVTSLIVPGQAGDASIILFLKKHGVAIKKTGLIYMFDKTITLAFFLVVSIFGAHLVIPDLELSFYTLCLPIIIIGTIGLIVWGLSSRVPFLARIKIKFVELWHVIQDFVRNKWNILLVNVAVTVIKWIITSLGFYLAFMAFGVRVDLDTIMVIPILSTLVGYIPVSIAGLGTVEVTATYLFSLVGIQQVYVLNAYLLLRLLQYGLAALILTTSSLFLRIRIAR
jgi:uncharacterized membrane protein YbhN (UPF0104 family)